MHDLFKYLVMAWLVIDGLSVVASVGKRRAIVTPKVAVAVMGGFIIMIFGMQLYL